MRFTPLFSILSALCCSAQGGLPVVPEHPALFVIDGNWNFLHTLVAAHCPAKSVSSDKILQSISGIDSRPEGIFVRALIKDANGSREMQLPLTTDGTQFKIGEFFDVSLAHVKFGIEGREVDIKGELALKDDGIRLIFVPHNAPDSLKVGREIKPLKSKLIKHLDSYAVILVTPEMLNYAAAGFERSTLKFGDQTITLGKASITSNLGESISLNVPLEFSPDEKVTFEIDASPDKTKGGQLMLDNATISGGPSKKVGLLEEIKAGTKIAVAQSYLDGILKDKGDQRIPVCAGGTPQVIRFRTGTAEVAVHFTVVETALRPISDSVPFVRLMFAINVQKPK